MGAEFGVASGRVAEGGEDVGVNCGGEVEVPVADGDDLAGGGVEGFDDARGWVGGDVVELVADSEDCELHVGFTCWRRGLGRRMRKRMRMRIIVAGATACRRLGFRFGWWCAKHDV